MKLIAALHRERRLRLPITWTEAVSIAAEREFGVLPA